MGWVVVQVEGIAEDGVQDQGSGRGEGGAGDEGDADVVVVEVLDVVGEAAQVGQAEAFGFGTR